VVSCYLLQREDKSVFQIPPEYKEFWELFTTEALEDLLPLYQPWDYEIKLKKEQELEKFKIYPLRED
jgi:hypothetical protein